MSWIYLFLAGLFEMGWPLGFKLSQMPGYPKWLWLTAAIVSMCVSGALLWLAQRGIPIGTAYVVWTGIGAVGTLLIGIFFFGDSASVWRMASALLIVAGIVGLRLAR
ncbi:MAG: multidrug efflux SMR transporter [Prevotellaceae bacterium]|jgi:quaternary ammonium compound-resistance protein SugE|nr:multidrug efflux SMR transporter [Prevotellaceae bacterium]